MMADRLVFLVDQSFSMSEPLIGSGQAKADAAAALIETTLARLAGTTPPVAVAVIGYGEEVRSILVGHSLELTALDRPATIDVAADGATPMCAALAIAADLLDDRGTIINVSDGAATDGDPAAVPLAPGVRLVNIAWRDNEAEFVAPSDASDLDGIDRQLWRASSRRDGDDPGRRWFTRTCRFTVAEDMIESACGLV